MIIGETGLSMNKHSITGFGGAPSILRAHSQLLKASTNTGISKTMVILYSAKLPSIPMGPFQSRQSDCVQFVISKHRKSAHSNDILRNTWKG